MSKNYSLNEFEKKVNNLIDLYFNNYNEYNEITINDFFRKLSYKFNTQEEDIANDAEQQIRNIVFKGGIKNATQNKN